MKIRALTVVALCLAACSTDAEDQWDGWNESGGGGGSAGAGGATGGSAGAGGATGGSSGSSCDPNPLRTGLGDPADIDTYDCLILDFTSKYAEPDAMIFKAIIRIESHFVYDAVGCTAPCGTPDGWTAEEVRCLGLMQIVAACNPDPGDLGLLPNGHPNMTTDPSSPDWTGSIFNPVVNIERGIAGIAGNRAQVMQEFPGCTEEQYTLMAIGNYNHYGSTKSCTEYNTEYDDVVLEFYRQYADAAGWSQRPY